MNYANIISDFTWSYSRITQFEMCPYGFLLHYIKRVPRKRLFFSDYGTFIHKIIELYLRNELKEEDLYTYYLTNFRQNVKGYAPNGNIFKMYFNQGLQYVSNIDFPYSSPLAVEERVDFYLDDKPFTGIIDCVAKEDGGYIVLDNKSRTLKPRSSRSKPTKSDEELDAYLRQPYLYSIPLKEKFGTNPIRLEFNCFRSGQLISEPFRVEDQENAKRWAVTTIDTIINNENWAPKMDYWKCRYLCDCNDSCCYFHINRR